MELEELKKYVRDNDNCTYLIVKKIDGIHVTVYKTKNVSVRDDSLWIFEKDYPECFIGYNKLVKMEGGFYSSYGDEGTTYETFIYNIKDNENLLFGIKEIDVSINSLEEMLNGLKHSRMFLYYEYLDRVERKIDWGGVVNF